MQESHSAIELFIRIIFQYILCDAASSHNDEFIQSIREILLFPLAGSYIFVIRHQIFYSYIIALKLKKDCFVFGLRIRLNRLRTAHT